MRIVRLLPLLLALILPALPLFSLAGSARKKTTSTAKKAPAKKSSNQAAARSKSSKKATVSRSSKRRGRTSRRRAARNLGQRAPEPERIKQIQSALAGRGYDIEPSGVWDQRSVEALKKFQDDNAIKNLTGKGKLDPLTLIALGLGPERGPQAGKPKTNSEGQQP
ncbi:MAG TPA: peptidoglycan-binding domain-containing protein [Bryobacteraceae bacterium]|nr:peptidoglycan-binding domain-containing protein [Bryobacteraceae bacterium]